MPQERPTLVEWVSQKGADEVRKYQLQNDRTSIDRLDTYLLPDADRQI